MKKKFAGSCGITKFIHLSNLPKYLLNSLKFQECIEFNFSCLKSPQKYLQKYKKTRFLHVIAFVLFLDF